MKTAKMLLYAGKREFAHTKNEWKIDAGKLMQITNLYWEVRLKNTTPYFKATTLQAMTPYYKVRLCTKTYIAYVHENCQNAAIRWKA